MPSTRLMIASAGALITLVLVGAGCAPQGQDVPTHVDWPMYRGDLGGTGYSPLTQITPTNVATLTQAWSYSLRTPVFLAAPPGQATSREPNSQATPIVVGDVMYFPAVDRVVAAEPGDWRANLVAVSGQRPALTARGRLLARRRRNAAACHLHRGDASCRDRRGDRHAGAQLRPVR